MARPPLLSEDAQALIAGLGIDANHALAHSARQTSAYDYELDGASFLSRTGYPTTVSPSDPSALRLTTNAAHPAAIAVYAVEPASYTFDSLPKRLDVDVRAAVPPSGQAEEFEYFIGVSDFTSSRWRWRGPYPAAPYSMLINTQDVRERYFDLDGNTLIAIALYSAAPAAIEVKALAYSTAGEFYPCKPYRPGAASISPWSGSTETTSKDGIRTYRAQNRLDVQNWDFTGTGEFASLGFDRWQLYRQDYDGELLAVEGGLNQPDRTPPAGGAPLPGVTYPYAIAVGNEFGFAAPSDPVPVETDFHPPQIRTADPSQSHVSLAWELQLGAEKYELWRDGRPYLDVTDSGGRCDDVEVTPGQLYRYRVVAHSSGASSYGPEQRALPWALPGYFLCTGDSVEGGSLVELVDGPGMLRGGTQGPSVSFSCAEAQVAVPLTPADWVFSGSPWLPGLEPQHGIFTPSGPAFASYLGRPACALHSGSSSTFSEFDLAIIYRQDPGMPPLPPSMLQWKETWCPTDSFVEHINLHQVGSRMAAAWRSQYSLKIWYGYSPDFQPDSGDDWNVSVVTAGYAFAVRMVELNSTPALLIDGKVFRTPFVQPSGPGDWTSYVLPGVAGGELGVVGGRLWVVYATDTGASYYRADVDEPTSAADWTGGVLPIADPGSGQRSVQVTDFGGKAAVMARDADGVLYLLLGSGTAAGEPEQWTKVPLEYEGTQAHALEVGGNLIVSCYVDSDVRQSGYYIHYLQP